MQHYLANFVIQLPVTTQDYQRFPAVSGQRLWFELLGLMVLSQWNVLGEAKGLERRRGRDMSSVSRLKRRFFGGVAMVVMLMRHQSVPGIFKPQAQAVRFRGKSRIDSPYPCYIQHGFREQMNRAFIVTKQFVARFAVHNGIYDAIPAEIAQIIGPKPGTLTRSTGPEPGNGTTGLAL